MSELEIAGRVALVTGAARGIGLETARALQARGASVAMLDLDRSEIEAAAASIGERTLPIAADVADEKAVRLAVEAAVTEFGGIDIVVANAGIAQPIRSVAAVDDGAFDRVLDVNLNGVVYTVRQALPYVIERRGHALVIASVYAFINGAMQSSYAMSKAAVEQYGRALRVELSRHGASAGVGYFGYVDTAMVADAYEDPIAARIEGLAPRPLRKRISPAEAAEALVNGIENRSARTIRPRRWALYSRLRGLVNPALDELHARNDVVRAAVAEGERELEEPR
ncbi:MAG TPA: short-chain dehydrogenase/reductase [Solirubrobacterales bacterium]|nr:short-chain dehydrogenase/reductase [Solirubrobacterales bacterium]